MPGTDVLSGAARVICATTTFWFAALVPIYPILLVFSSLMSRTENESFYQVGQSQSFPDPLPWHRFWILILFTPVPCYARSSTCRPYAVLTAGMLVPGNVRNGSDLCTALPALAPSAPVLC
eukprot:1876290-Rhodomonas_salina.3